MAVIFWLLSKRVSGDQPTRPPCRGKHIIITTNRQCKCMEQYPFGDPYSDEGCFSCNPVCHPDALCVSPDKCKCKAGFLGDGVYNCTKPIPELLSMDRQTCIAGGEDLLLLKVGSPENFTPPTAFCNFGPRIVEAVTFNASYFACKCPDMLPAETHARVSYDGDLWSLESIPISINAPSFSSYDAFCISLCCIFFATAAILVVSIVRRRKSGQLAQMEDALPLNRWHMHQAQHEMMKETNFFAFLINILFN